MQKRSLGTSGIEVSPLCFGGNVFGWTADEATSFKLLDRFTESGFNFIDTADVYSRWVPGNQGGESETILGKWLSQGGRRDQVVIATKCGLEMGPSEKGLSRQYIVKAAERSLKRLQVERIDLYQAHTDDDQTPLDETLEAFGKLIEQGKVRAIGASNYSGRRLQEALDVSRRHGFPGYVSLQPLYNLADRSGYELDLEPVCEKNGLAVIPYYSLAAGFLTGKYRSGDDLTDKARGKTVEKYLNERGERILAALDEVAARYHTVPAKVALAWLLARPSITAPIVSATSLKQLDEVLDSTRLKLDGDAVSQLNAASQ
ncbi:aldo/keto reductase [Planctomyces sp. SH-PL14]|uniref:aldo/keto reductase n=1 Tax=Planctomyces sp. SH-PL14 TaxID=1632864 RepID=UPI00078C1B30|nr:aldo/keto reductase [Planctomyces sp. SH-PL14]AMV18714.1 General stress protein 69 [Planctomyces sp. SH-PL14]